MNELKNRNRSLIENVEYFFCQNQIDIVNTKLLIAVSGGMDSMVLLEICRRLNLNISVAHVNYQLRNDESDLDQNLVEDYCNKNAIKYFVKRFDTKEFADKNKLGIQEAARNLRYDWFSSLMIENEIDYLLTAHHLDDSIETTLMNFFNGTGINGLTGIPAINKNILRPMIDVPHKLIEEFAEKENIPYRIDSSNLKSDYTRNFIRNEVIPLLNTRFEIGEIFGKNINRLKEVAEVYNNYFENWFNKNAIKNGNEIYIPVLKLLKAIPFESTVYELINRFGFSNKYVDEVEKLLSAQTGKYIENNDYRILKNRNWLIIYPINKESKIDFLLVDESQEIVVNNLLIKAKLGLPKTLNIDPMTAQLDAKNIDWPLQIRNWKAGDYFYPLGMKHKKKVKDFLSNLKLSRKEKDETMVVLSGDKIIWVVGYRIDDRFKITENTQSALTISAISQVN